MHNRLSYYFQANNILVPKQFGLRKGISTDNAAIKLTVYSNLLIEKCVLVEYSVICQKLLTV
jgi:hypothetical protein